MRNGQGGYSCDARRPRADPVADRHRRLGAVHSSAARRVRPHRRPTASSRRRPTPLPLDVFVVASKDPAAIMREYARITGLPEMPALWTFGYQQSHRTLAGPDEIMWVAQDVAREEAAVRRADLPRHRLHAVGLEHAQRRVHLAPEELPRSEEDDRRAARRSTSRSCCTSSSKGGSSTGTVNDPCTARAACPSGRTPTTSWPPERQVGCYWPHHKTLYRPRHRRLVARPGRRPRRAVAPERGIRMYWEGTQLWRPNERPFALHRNGYAGHAALRRVPLVGRRALDVGDAEDARAGRRSTPGSAAFRSGAPTSAASCRRRSTRASCTCAGSSSRAFCPLFRSHGRNWHLRLPWGWNTGELRPDGDGELSRRADPESELHNAQVEPICRKYLELRYRLMPYLYTAVRETRETGHADHARAVAALSRRSDGRRARRSVSVGPRHPGRAGRREGRDVAQGLSAAAAPGSTSGRTSASTAAARSIAPVDLATMPLYVRAGAIIPMGPVKQYTAEPVDGPLTRHRVSRRRRRVRAVRRRRPVVRVPARRVDGTGDALVGPDRPPVCLARPRVAHAAVNASRPAGSSGRKYATQTIHFDGRAQSVSLRPLRLRAEARAGEDGCFLLSGLHLNVRAVALLLDRHERPHRSIQRFKCLYSLGSARVRTERRNWRRAVRLHR